MLLHFLHKRGKEEAASVIISKEKEHEKARKEMRKHFPDGDEKTLIGALLLAAQQQQQQSLVAGMSSPPAPSFSPLLPLGGPERSILKLGGIPAPALILPAPPVVLVKAQQYKKKNKNKTVTRPSSSGTTRAKHCTPGGAKPLPVRPLGPPQSGWLKPLALPPRLPNLKPWQIVGSGKGKDDPAPSPWESSYAFAVERSIYENPAEATS